MKMKNNKDKVPVFDEHENINDDTCKLKYGYCVHWPYNMLAAMFEQSESEIKKFVNLDDLSDTLNFALNRLEDNRKREILLYRFMGGNTYKTIGDIYKVTGERIRQITVETLYKLRFSKYSKLIRFGIHWENMYLQLRNDEYQLSRNKNKNKKLKKLVEYLLLPDSLPIDDFINIVFSRTTSSGELFKEKLLEAGISNLGEMKKAYLNGSLKKVIRYCPLMNRIGLTCYEKD